jgi:hypothetical protein
VLRSPPACVDGAGREDERQKHFVSGERLRVRLRVAATSGATSGGRDFAVGALGTRFVWHLYGNNMPHSPTLRNCHNDLTVVILPS